jgi:hypothetical protein
MKLPEDIDIYGDQTYRGECPSESAEQVTFFARIRMKYPDTWGKIALHPRNEGRRTFMQSAHQMSEGMAKGACDIIIPGAPSFVCELKRRDHTKSTWQSGQLDYLRVAQRKGAFACVALGADAAEEAFNRYLDQTQSTD